MDCWPRRGFSRTVAAVWDLKPQHCRAARHLLDWRVIDLARASGISQQTIARFERGEAPEVKHKTVRLLVEALSEAGVRFELGEPQPRHFRCDDGALVTLAPEADPSPAPAIGSPSEPE